MCTNTFVLFQSPVHEVQAANLTSTHASKTMRFGHGLQFLGSPGITWGTEQTIQNGKLNFCCGRLQSSVEVLHVKNPATRNRTRDHLITARIYSQMLYQLSYSRLERRNTDIDAQVRERSHQSAASPMIIRSCGSCCTHGSQYDGCLV